MKTTGVSRRIDDLGRIVIPKEIRKSLKIRDGELLEILVEDEKILLAKHSSMNNVVDTARLYVESVGDVIEADILITDRDKVVAASGQIGKKYVDKDLSIEVSELLLKHSVVVEREPKKLKIDNDNEEFTTYVSYPIIVESDVAGLVILLGQSNKINETDTKIAEVISKFLSRNIL